MYITYLLFAPDSESLHSGLCNDDFHPPPYDDSFHPSPIQKNSPPPISKAQPQTNTTLDQLQLTFNLNHATKDDTKATYTSHPDFRGRDARAWALRRPRAAHTFNLMQGGHMYPLNEADKRPLQEYKAIFGEGIRDTPMLSGHEDLPFEALSTAIQVKKILIEDIGGENNFCFAPSRGLPELDAQATLDLLLNIRNPAYKERGAVIHMISPTLDRLRANTPSWQSEGLLEQASFQITIAPASEVFDLQYYEHYRASTLLMGSRVVIAYPPSRSNLSLLLEQYSKLRGEQTGDIFGTTYSSLQHGFAIVQKRGETLTIPLFWSFVTFYTTTAVAAEYCVATATKYPLRLERTDLYLATTRMWPDTSKQQIELIKYVALLVTHLHLILNNKIPHFNAARVVLQLCKKWDKYIKGKVSALCAEIEDQGERGRSRNMFHAAWVPFIDRKRKKRPECRLCHERFEGLRGANSDAVDRRLTEHVVGVHGFCLEAWVASGPVVAVE
jgi:hypothetical protein